VILPLQLRTRNTSELSVVVLRRIEVGGYRWGLRAAVFRLSDRKDLEWCSSALAWMYLNVVDGCTLNAVRKTLNAYNRFVRFDF